MGEEAEQQGDTFVREVGAVAAPIDQAQPKFSTRAPRRASTSWSGRARSDTSFRAARSMSFDIWLELQAMDATGRVIFWSGRVEDGGKGPVEPGRAFL